LHILEKIADVLPYFILKLFNKIGIAAFEDKISLVLTRHLLRTKKWLIIFYCTIMSVEISESAKLLCAVDVVTECCEGGDSDESLTGSLLSQNSSQNLDTLYINNTITYSDKQPHTVAGLSSKATAFSIEALVGSADRSIADDIEHLRCTVREEDKGDTQILVSQRRIKQKQPPCTTGQFFYCSY